MSFKSLGFIKEHSKTIL